MTIQERDKKFKEQVYEQPFVEHIQRDFYEYWSEPNKSKTQMRFELEKTWDLSRRMKRWQRIQDCRPDFLKGQIVRAEKVMTKIPTNDFERLEALFTAYCLRPTGIASEVFGEYYEFMRINNLLKELSEEDKELLRRVYGKNVIKIKCAWVQKTLEWFAITGFPKKVTPLKKVV